MRTVIARYKTVKTQFKQKPKRYKDIHTGKYHTLYKDLYHLTKPLGFKRPVAVFVRNRNYAYHQDDTYSLTTNQGRIKVSCDKRSEERRVGKEFSRGVVVEDRIVDVHRLMIMS